MSKELAQTVGGKRLALLIAILVGFAFLAAFKPLQADAAVTGPAKFRTNIACNPLSTAQVAPGTVQTCTIRVINVGGEDATNVTAYRFGGWTTTSVTAWKRVPLAGSGGSVVSYAGVSCVSQTTPECSVATLEKGGQFFIQVKAVRKQVQDGYGLSEGCSMATGISLNCVQERASLP